MYTDEPESARAALALANDLGDSLAQWDAKGMLMNVLQVGGHFDEAMALAAERNSLQAQISDPDRLADHQYVTAYLSVVTGHLADARRVAGEMEQNVAGLTPHHRVHGLGVRVMVERAFADWEAICGLTGRIEAAVEANQATPCPYNHGLLVALAAAWTYQGNPAEADRLLARGEQVGMGSYHRFQARHALRVAIAREDLPEIRRVIDMFKPNWLMADDWEQWTNLFDGLALLGDRDRIETEAQPWLAQDVYVTAFALRALAVVRRDPGLVDDAVQRFDAMGAERLAADTRAMKSRIAEVSQQ